MKALWYILTVLLGAYGTLSLLRAGERFLHGMPMLAVQIILGVVALILAWRCLIKARQSGPRTPGS